MVGFIYNFLFNSSEKENNNFKINNYNYTIYILLIKPHKIYLTIIIIPYSINNLNEIFFEYNSSYLSGNNWPSLLWLVSSITLCLIIVLIISSHLTSGIVNTLELFNIWLYLKIIFFKLINYYKEGYILYYY